MRSQENQLPELSIISNKPKEDPKTEYVSPKLTVYGSISLLTAGGSVTGMMGMAGMENNGMGGMGGMGGMA